MQPQFSTGVFNQVRWPKAGDVDDCWCLADMMAVHGVAPWLWLPTITDYRTAANKPDVPGEMNGGTVSDSARAIGVLWPRLPIELLNGGAWPDLLAKLKSARPASLSVLSGALPANLQFGFAGAHRVTVWWDGATLRLMNPLARPHARSKPITDDALKVAVDRHPDPGVHAVVMPTIETAFRTHPMFQAAVDEALHPPG